MTKLMVHGNALYGLLTSPVWAGCAALIAIGFLAALVESSRSVRIAWGTIVTMMVAFAFVYLTMTMDPTRLAVLSMPRLWGDFAPALAYLSILSVFGDTDSPNSESRTSA